MIMQTASAGARYSVSAFCGFHFKEPIDFENYRNYGVLSFVLGVAPDLGRRGLRGHES